MIYLIGMGPGNLDNLTMEAVDILKHSTKVVSFGRIGTTAESLNRNVIKVKSISEIGSILENLEKENKKQNDSIVISVLASGDPCFYGILEFLKKQRIEIARVIPGVSSIQYMMAELQMSWHNANLLSFHGREEERGEKIKKILKSPLSIILTDKKNTPSVISKELHDKNMTGTLYAGFDLSYPEEQIIKADIGEEIEHESALAVVVVERGEKHEMD